MLVVKVLQNNDIPGTMTTNHSEQELFLNWLKNNMLFNT
jgi:hypothetical protein